MNSIKKTDDESYIIMRNRLPLKFFLLVFVLSIPFWIAGAFTDFQILPGIPISALGLLCMMGAASILVYRENGFAGVIELLKRSFDFKRVKAKAWYWPTFLIMPAVMVLSFIAMRLMGTQIPAPQFSFATPFILFIVFFIAAIGEELGWSGYAIDPLQARFGALGGALVLGIVWAVWHFIPLLSVARSTQWIVWWLFGTLALRVIITWLYNNTGRSVFIAVIFHAMFNVTWQLFPINGSYYDPRVTSLIMVAVAVFVVIVWGSQTMVRTQGAGNADLQETVSSADEAGT